MSFLLDTAHGMVYLHQKVNRIHGDLKPDNLLVDLHGRVAVTGFGTSHIMHMRRGSETSSERGLEEKPETPSKRGWWGAKNRRSIPSASALSYSSTDDDDDW